MLTRFAELFSSKRPGVFQVRQGADGVMSRSMYEPREKHPLLLKLISGYYLFGKMGAILWVAFLMLEARTNCYALAS